MSITHKPKTGLTLTGTEYEAADAHVVVLEDADIPATIARDSEVTAAINAVIDAAPGALDTLNELAAALGDDANFATTVTNALAAKQPLDADLTAIAALTTTAFGRGLLELANAAALLSAAGAEAAGTTATHTGDTSDAHDASAISVADVGGDFAATDVEGVLVEIHGAWQTSVSGHVNDASDAHDASAVSFVAGGTIAATDVQAAITEVADDAIAAINAVDSALTTHAGAADPHAGYLKEADFDDIDFLVGTATGHTAAEIVVGTAPGGELGGTWASPTVDATHSGSSHAGVIATHEAASDPHTGYVREADANWVDLTDGGATTLHSHSGSSVFTAFTKDLGAADRAGTFDITGLSGLVADKPVMVMQTAAAIASKGNARDEPEMDQIQVTGYVVDSSTIRCYWQAEGVVVGTYAFAYLVGA